MISFDDMIKCVGREFVLLRKVYKGWVAGNRVKSEVAEKEIETMKAVLETLKEYKYICESVPSFVIEVKTIY
jgi:hypothetical protein